MLICIAHSRTVPLIMSCVVEGSLLMCNTTNTEANAFGWRFSFIYSFVTFCWWSLHWHYFDRCEYGIDVLPPFKVSNSQM